MSYKIAPKIQAILVDLGKAEVALVGAQNSRTISEHQSQVDSLLEQKSQLRRQAAGTQIRAQDLEWDIDRLKSDVEKLEQRTRAEETAVAEATDPEEARDLKFDLRATRRRMAELHVHLAEAIKHRDAYEGHYDSAGANSDDIDARLAAAQRDLAAAEEATAQRIASAHAVVQDMRHQIPEDILALYDQHSVEAGIGAARLRGRICGACGMELSNATIAELAALPLDEAGECPECGALLVRGATIDLVLEG